MRRNPWPVLTATVGVAIMFLLVFPTRAFLSQRAQLSHVSSQDAALTASNRHLAAEASKLDTDAEIEKIAREQYGLVRPGQEAYAIVPAPGQAPGALAANGGGGSGGKGSAPAAPKVSPSPAGTSAATAQEDASAAGGLLDRLGRELTFWR